MLTQYLLRETEAESDNSSTLACAVTHALVHCHRNLSADISEPPQACLVTATELKNQNL